MAVLDYEGLNRRSNNISRDELVKYLTKIGCRQTRHNGSHMIFQNAAGSLTTIPIGGNKPDVTDNLRRAILVFVNEHRAAEEHQQSHDDVAAPVIHIDDEDAIEAAGLQLHSLSQEDRTVTLTDIHYPEIAVMIHLHDDLVVSESHIKAAAAERDALVNAYEVQLQQLKTKYHIGRMVIDGEPRLQIISKNSGQKKTGTQDVAVPTLEECDTIEALNAARDNAVADITTHAEDISVQSALPARFPARTEALRNAEFEALQTTLATVGLTLEAKRIDASRVAYDCRYIASTFASLAEGLDARKMQNRTPGELRQFYPGVDEETLRSLLEVHSSKGAELLCVVDNHNDGAPSEEALEELKTTLAHQAAHRKQQMISLLKARDSMVVQAKDNGVTSYCFPPSPGGSGKPRFGVASHAKFEYLDRPKAINDNALIPSKVMRDLTVIDRIRLFDGFRRYEHQLLNALGTLGATAAFVEDTKGMGVSIQDSKGTELVRVPVVLDNVNGLSPYLIQLGQEVGRLYMGTLPRILASFGWNPVRETRENVYYKHQTLPDEIAIPCYNAALLNHEAIMDALGMVDNCMQRAETNHVDTERAEEYRQCIGLLKELGYREVANGKTKLHPPRDVPKLSAITLRDPDTYTVKQSDLLHLLRELEKASALQQEQQHLISRIQQAFGNDFSQDETGITLQVPRRKSDQLMPQPFPFAVTRSGEPSGYLSIDSVRQLTVQLNGRSNAGFVEKYAQRSTGCAHDR